MRLAEEIIFRLSMRVHKTPSKQTDLSHRPATFDRSAYVDWRTSNVVTCFQSYFKPEQIYGKRVLDFGCGMGAPLSFYVLEQGAAHVTGADLPESYVIENDGLARSRGTQKRMTFVAGGADRIALPDSSVDVIACFDVMEHVMEHEAVMREWKRVLAPEGKVLVYWTVYYHPYGHHMGTMIPLPWVHILVDEPALYRVCARMYDSPAFVPRFWHFDDNGVRLPNPYRGVVKSDDLNQLTIRQFVQSAESAGLSVTRKEIHPFGGRFQVIKKLLVRIAGDYFSAFAVFELTKSA